MSMIASADVFCTKSVKGLKIVNKKYCKIQISFSKTCSRYRYKNIAGKSDMESTKCSLSVNSM